MLLEDLLQNLALTITAATAAARGGGAAAARGGGNTISILPQYD